MVETRQNEVRSASWYHKMIDVMKFIMKYNEICYVSYITEMQYRLKVFKVQDGHFKLLLKLNWFLFLIDCV